MIPLATSSGPAVADPRLSPWPLFLGIGSALALFLFEPRNHVPYLLVSAQDQLLQKHGGRTSESAKFRLSRQWHSARQETRHPKHI